jgi:hypothetical protein
MAHQTELRICAMSPFDSISGNSALRLRRRSWIGVIQIVNNDNLHSFHLDVPGESDVRCLNDTKRCRCCASRKLMDRLAACGNSTLRFHICRSVGNTVMEVRRAFERSCEAIGWRDAIGNR